MIYKKERRDSETGTSIEQGIKVSQVGIITAAPTAGKTLLIPTTVPVPTGLNLTPMSVLSGLALGDWSTDLVKHYATVAGASTGMFAYGSLASLISLSEVNGLGSRLRLSRTYKLYQAVASMAATTAASHSRLASNSLFRELESFNDGGKNYITVTVGNAASGSWKGKKQAFAYEVVGYNR